MAGYNNYFPQSYLNSIYGYGAPVSSVQTQTNAINWVQGEAGARSVPVSAGQKILLMDSETNVFYVKSSDQTGMPLPLRIFEYKEVTNDRTSSQDGGAPNTYVTHEELDKILAELKSEKPKEEKKNEQFLI